MPPTAKSDVIVFAPRHMTSWREMLPIAERMRKDARLRPVFLIAVGALKALIPECSERGIEAVDVVDHIAPRDTGLLESLVHRLGPYFSKHKRLGSSLPIGLLRAWAYRRQLRHEHATITAALREIGAGAVMLPGDRELSPVPPLIKAAKSLGLPSIIVMATLPFIDAVTLPRQHDPSHQARLSRRAPLLNMWAAHRWPRQVWRGSLLFSPGWLTYALAAEDMLPAYPWVIGASGCSHTVQGDELRMDEFVRLGLPKEKCLLIGEPNTDPLYEAYAAREEWRQTILQRYGLGSSRPLAIFAVPNEAEHGFSTWPEHLSRLDTYLAILTERCDVLMALHPKSKAEDYSELARRNGARISDFRLHDVIAAGDLFVSGVSTTATWAQLCGVPAITLNYLNLALTSGVAPKHVEVVKTPEQFKAKLSTTPIPLPSGHYYLAEGHAARMRSRFDGKALERLIDLLCGAQPSTAARTA